MTAEQIFVGSVAVLLGLLALVGAIHNHDWYFRLDKARWIDNHWGRPAARIVYLLIGFALIALGIGIALGW